jgi:hypothetical protein
MPFMLNPVEASSWIVSAAPVGGLTRCIPITTPNEKQASAGKVRLNPR